MANKFTYDTANKLFILNTGVTSLDAKTEFYSWVKSDWKTNPSLTKFRFPIESIGGQSIGAGQTVSPYYQLKYGWKLRPQEASHTLTVLGNVITDDGSDPFVVTLGSYNVQIKYVVSANSITSAAQASVVWDELNGIEAGLSPRGAMRLAVAALAGKLSGSPSGPVVVRNAVADSKDRITATVDSDGNRTAVTTDVT